MGRKRTSRHTVTLFMAAATFASPRIARATVYYWDTNGSATGSGAATGTWGTDQFFTTTSAGTTTPGVITPASIDSAIFSAGSNGTTGTITVNGTQSITAMSINQSGLTFSGGTISLQNNVNNSISLSIGGSSNSPTISSALTFAGTNSTWLVLSGAGQTLTLQGGESGTTSGIYGSNATNGAAATLQLGGSGTTYQFSTYDVGDPTDISGGTFLNAGATVNGAVTVGVFGAGGSRDGLFTVNGGTISSTSVIISRAGGNGRMIVSSGQVTDSGILSVGFSTSAGQPAGNGVLDIKGGTVSVTSDIRIGNGLGSSSGGTATLNIVGGTTAAATINFGASSTVGTGTLNVSAGELYVGTGGLVNNGTVNYAYAINLSGGTLGASGNFTSSLAMSLTNTSGGITFKSADVNNTAHDITLSGVLSGSGSLTKTGAGKLTIANASNSYSGGTTISAGALVATGHLGSGSTASVVINGGVLELSSSSAIDDGATLDVTALTGSGQVILDDGVNESVGLLVLGGTTYTTGTFGADNNEYFGGTGSLTVVPEPSVAGLSILGLAVLGLRRRRVARHFQRTIIEEAL